MALVERGASHPNAVIDPTAEPTGALVVHCGWVAVIAGGAVSRIRIRAHSRRMVASAGYVALVGCLAHHRIASRACARHARVSLRASIPIIARSPAGLRGPTTLAGAGCALLTLAVRVGRAVGPACPVNDTACSRNRVGAASVAHASIGRAGQPIVTAVRRAGADFVGQSATLTASRTYVIAANILDAMGALAICAICAAGTVALPGPTYGRGQGQIAGDTSGAIRIAMAWLGQTG